MHKEFNMSMMGDLIFFLGVKINQKKNGIFICQSKYVKDLIKKYNMDQWKSAYTPMSATVSLDQDLNGKSVDQMSYRDMIGSLLYLTASLAHIIFSFCLCARFQTNPKESHLTAVKRIFKYLHGVKDFDQWYPSSGDFASIGFSDTDFAGYKVKKRVLQNRVYF